MRIRAMFVGAVLAVASAALAPETAAAHEGRHVGDLEMVVGFGTEPAYTGQPNSVQLVLAHHGEPVTDLGDSLSVEVSHGGASSDLALEPFFEIGEFGTPGDYRAWFVPSEPGVYAFRFTGSIEGERVNETFRSGPKTFSEVEDIRGATFPEVVAPTADELAERIERETARSADAIEATAVAAASADDAASAARTIGIIGVVVGALGLAIGIVVLATARRRARS
jgi:hypothetical protein